MSARPSRHLRPTPMFHAAAAVRGHGVAQLLKEVGA
jgi:hypothetical protein